MNSTIKKLRVHVNATRRALRDLQIEDIVSFSALGTPSVESDPIAQDLFKHDFSDVLEKLGVKVFLHEGSTMCGIVYDCGQIFILDAAGQTDENLRALCDESIDTIWMALEEIFTMKDLGLVYCPEDGVGVTNFDYRLHMPGDWDNDIPDDDDILVYTPGLSSPVFITAENYAEMTCQGYSLRDTDPSRLPFPLPEGINPDSLRDIKMMEDSHGHWGCFKLHDLPDMAMKHPALMYAVGGRDVFLPMENHGYLI